jgi:hypothetical protein
MKLNTLATTIFVTAFLTLTLVNHASAQNGWGHLKGKIVVNGDVPPPVKLNVDKDKAVCLKDGPLERAEVVVNDNGELKNAFIMMYFSRNDEKPAIHPDYEKSFNTPVEFDNVECRFQPHAIFVRTGQDVVLKNSDSIGHSCKFQSLNNDYNFNVPPNDKLTIQLKDEDKVPGDVSCGMHGWMKGIFLVREEPYAAITGDDGSFEIRNIPAGKWKFQFWHKKAGYMKDLKQDGKDFLGRRGEIEIEIKDGETFDFGKLEFDSANFK